MVGGVSKSKPGRRGASHVVDVNFRMVSEKVNEGRLSEEVSNSNGGSTSWSKRKNSRERHDQMILIHRTPQHAADARTGAVATASRARLALK